MATKSKAPAAKTEADTSTSDRPESDDRPLNEKIAEAVSAVDDYVYVEVRHEGQTYAAWRSRNGVVHVENRGQ